MVQHNSRICDYNHSRHPKHTKSLEKSEKSVFLMMSLPSGGEATLGVSRSNCFLGLKRPVCVCVCVKATSFPSKSRTQLAFT